MAIHGQLVNYNNAQYAAPQNTIGFVHNLQGGRATSAPPVRANPFQKSPGAREPLVSDILQFRSPGLSAIEKINRVFDGVTGCDDSTPRMGLGATLGTPPLRAVPQRLRLSESEGHVWLTEHPEHQAEDVPIGERPVLIHAGGTLEKPKNVHTHLWPQLSAVGELDLAIVDFGRQGFLRSNEFQVQRVMNVIDHLVSLGYSPRMMALSGGSKGAFASASAAVQLKEKEQQLAALILVSPVLSAHAALSVLRDRVNSGKGSKALRIVLDLLCRHVKPDFLDITRLPLNGNVRTFVVQGGQDWANNDKTNARLRTHFEERFSGCQRKNLQWIKYEDAGHRLEVEKHHVRWMLAFLYDKPLAIVVGALASAKYRMKKMGIWR